MHVIKPVIYARCSRCGGQGHKASSEMCPALVPPELQASVKAFRGHQNPLSNLHICPEGCSWNNNDDLNFVSSEHEYQYEKLVEHGHTDKAESLLEELHVVDGMTRANFIVPDDTLNPHWVDKKMAMMEVACRNKFTNCEHARKVLLESKSELAECTQNKEWGRGHQRMVQTLPDYWPGKNWLGQILKKICSELLEDIRLSQIESGLSSKHKGISLITNGNPKRQQVEQ